MSPAGEQANLPQDLLHNTFELYWKRFTDRRDANIEWKDYTPYEWRTVGSFVRLGWRERAGEAIDFFMRDRRPVDAIEYCDKFSLDEMPEDVLNLMHLLYSMIQASFPVECWKQPKVPDSGATTLDCVSEPVP